MDTTWTLYIEQRNKDGYLIGRECLGEVPHFEIELKPIVEDDENDQRQQEVDH